MLLYFTVKIEISDKLICIFIVFYSETWNTNSFEWNSLNIPKFHRNNYLEVSPKLSAPKRVPRNSFLEFFITVLPSKVSGNVTEDPLLLSHNRISILRTFDFFESQNLSHFEKPETLSPNFLLLFCHQKFRGKLLNIQIYWRATGFLFSVHSHMINFFSY